MPATTPATTPAAHAPPTSVAAWLPALLPVLALLVLVASLRGAPLGQPVADDWAFLARRAFGPFDLFDSMGAAYYWRPLSRQLWFSLFAGVMLHAPVLMSAVHIGLIALMALLSGRIARALGASAITAAVIACAPLAAEPARVLLAWPSGAQHLLAGVLALLALHEALAGRRSGSFVAALAALLAHELAVLPLALLPLAFARGRAARASTGAAVALGAALIWIAGYAVALRHGVQLPPGFTHAPLSGLVALFVHVGAGVLNLEDMPRTALPAVLGAGAGIALLAMLGLGPRSGRRAHPAWRPAGVLLALGMLGTLPLAALLPDWNAWRAFVPIVAVTAAIGWFLGSVSPAAAVGFALLRIVTLAMAPPSHGLTRELPAAVSDVSFLRLARMQQLSTGLNDALRKACPTLPRGARIAYWSLPPYAEIAFQHGQSVQVCYGDSDLVFVPFGGREVLAHLPAAVASFDLSGPEQHVTILAPEALSAYHDALEAHDGRQPVIADSAYRRALELQRPDSATLTSTVLRNRALLALDRNEVEQAEALLAEAERFMPDVPDGHAITALVALRRNDWLAARVHITRCLSIEPNHRVGQIALEEWRRAGGAPLDTR